jgi:uncharacterized membrane protein YdjX (TVP38/TMEM64 family)
MKLSKILIRNILLFFALIVFFIWGWFDHFSVLLPFDWSDPQNVVESIRESGAIGPFVIIASMALAIVFSPLPSAPIAMAAGATYGHFEGTLYIFMGSLIGSSFAFGISRIMRFETARVWLEQRFPKWELSDQRRLMWLVMVSRLMPFVSFDLMSYAAGVTVLSYWRFLLATAIGIAPASFLLAHFGDAAMEQSFTINVVLAVALTVIAGIWAFKSGKNKRSKFLHQEDPDK